MSDNDLLWRIFWLAFLLVLLGTAQATLLYAIYTLLRDQWKEAHREPSPPAR